MDFARWHDCAMRDLAVLVLHLLVTVARLLGPGGVRSVVAESVLVKHQLLILNRSRKRSPHLRISDRIVAGLCALLVRPGRLIRAAIVLKPSTLLTLHRALTKRKYRLLFSTKVPTKPGPKGPSRETVAAVVDMKRRNPSWGCPRIAQQIAIGLRHSDQQGRSAADPRRAVPAGTRLGWAILAHGPRSRERQSVESRSVSLRISHPAHPLGARRDGPLVASYRGLWRAPRRCRWRRLVSNVQSSDSRPNHANVPQLGPRSAVSIPSMAGESADSRRQGNQDGAVRAALASLRRTADWHRSARVPGSNPLLDGRAISR